MGKVKLQEYSHTIQVLHSQTLPLAGGSDYNYMGVGSQINHILLRPTHSTYNCHRHVTLV